MQKHNNNKDLNNSAWNESIININRIIVLEWFICFNLFNESVIECLEVKLWHLGMLASLILWYKLLVWSFKTLDK